MRRITGGWYVVDRRETSSTVTCGARQDLIGVTKKNFGYLMHMVTNLDRNLSPIFTLHVSLLSNHGRVLGRLQAGNIFKILLN